MPVYRGIKLSIISQYGAQALPEYSPSQVFDHPIRSPSPNGLPALLDSTTHTATVYIPIFPRSVYWIRYHVYVPGSIPYFYFKAFINGKHVVSWGVGEADGYGGKVMFGLYDNGRIGGMPSRQLLAFSDDTSLDYQASVPPGEESLEIRVYRSKGRRAKQANVPPLVDIGSSSHRKVGSARFRNAFGFKLGGEVDANHPFTHYEYALIDAIDAPYAVFRWLPRTWHELDQLDVISLDSEPGSELTATHHAAQDREEFNVDGASSDARTELEQHGASPFHVAGEGSPLRVPVYQVSCSTLEPDKSPTREYTGGESHTESDKKNDPATSTPRRSRVLEPYNSFDCVATAQPANRGTLLDSVVSQLVSRTLSPRSRSPDVPSATKMLQHYLAMRQSEKSTQISSKYADVSNITYVTRPRADSYQAQLECSPSASPDQGTEE